MQRVCIISVILVWAALYTGAQTTDTATHQCCAIDRIIELNCISIKPACSCRGDCTCGMKNINYYTSNAFSSTDEILARAESIALIRRGNYAMEPALRSMTGGQVNLTIDGMKLFSACTDRMDPVTSYIEPNNLKSLSVSHGVSGAKFGSTIGGTVDMKLNEPVISHDKPLKGEAGSGFQSSSLGFNGLFSLNYSQKKWAVAANTVYRKHHDYRAGNGDKIEFSQYQKWNFSACGKVMLAEKDVLRFDFLMDDATDVGYPALPMDVAYARARIYGLTYKKYELSKNIEAWETKVYANTVDHAMDDTKRPYVTMHMDMPGNSRTAGGFSDLRIKINRHRLNLRVEGYNNRSIAEMTMYVPNEEPMYMLTWPDVRRSAFAGFGNYEVTLRKESTVNVSGRLEVVFSKALDETGIHEFEIFGFDISETVNHLLKTLNFNYSRKLKEKLTIAVNAGYGERAPTVTEQYGFYIFNSYDGYDYIGKPDIKTEKSLQSELTITFDNEKIEVAPTVFWYLIKDYMMGFIQSELSTMTIGANGVKMYNNISNAMLFGGSLRAAYRPVKDLAITERIEYTNGRDDNENPLPLIPPFRSTTGIEYGYKNFLIQAECEAATKQNRVSPEFGEAETPAYAILNLRGTYSLDFSGKILKVNSGIENLLDANYREHLDWGGILRPGINFYLNVNFTF